MAKWTREELNNLSAVWPDAEMEDICKMFPSHNRGAISSKASYLGLKKSKAYLSTTNSVRAAKFVSRSQRKSALLKRSFQRVGVLLRAGFKDEALAIIDEALGKVKELD